MRWTLKLTLFLTFMVFFNCSQEKENILEIDGKTIGTETTSIILLKPNQDTRFDSIIEIPVIDGKFHYESKLEHPEAVSLFLTKDLGRFMPLFLENEKMNLTIYDQDEFDKNLVEGGELNAQYKAYKQSLDEKFEQRLKPLQDSLMALSDRDQYKSDQAKLLFEELREAKSQDEKVPIYRKIDGLQRSRQYLSPQAQALEDKIKPIYEEQKVFQQDYIRENPTLVSYSFLLESLIFDKETIDIQEAKKSYQILSKANPNHPYNELASNLINAIENVKIGKKFTDFSAPDLDGNAINLSDKINGKIALLDLWATWCGPCIAKSRTMVQVYNDYKDKGFTIVGVAGEFRNTDNLVKFLDKEKWEWLNLVELDRKNGIWQKYGVDGGGGGMFLVDEQGIILAKDPTAEEVRKVLETRLN